MHGRPADAGDASNSDSLRLVDFCHRPTRPHQDGGAVARCPGQGNIIIAVQLKNGTFWGRSGYRLIAAGWQFGCECFVLLEFILKISMI